METRRAAVLVDGDNIAAVHRARILRAAAGLGRVDVVRVYTDATRKSDWLTAEGYGVMHAGVGKNAADVLLSLDALELLLADGIKAFVIASSDGDFAHLAHRLRSRGGHVLGLGGAQASRRFQAACSEFECLAGPGAPAGSEAVSGLDRQIRGMIAGHSQNGHGMRITVLAQKMHAAHGVRISTFAERNWRTYLCARPTLYDLDPKGPNAQVRVRPDGFAARTP